MRRRLLIALLGFGAFAGFASGLASLHCHRFHGGYGYGPFHHADFERHVADVCTDAALRAQRR